MKDTPQTITPIKDQEETDVTMTMTAMDLELVVHGDGAKEFHDPNHSHNPNHNLNLKLNPNNSLKMINQQLR